MTCYILSVQSVFLLRFWSVVCRKTFPVYKACHGSKKVEQHCSRHVSRWCSNIHNASAFSLLIMAQIFLLSVKELWSEIMKTSFANCDKIWKSSYITNLPHILGFEYWLVRGAFEKMGVSDRRVITELFPIYQSSDTLAFYLPCVGFCDRTQFWLSLSCMWIRPFFSPLRHFGIEITEAVLASLFCQCVLSFSCETGTSFSFCLSCNKLICLSLCTPVFFHLCE